MANKFRSLTEAIRAPWIKKSGLATNLTGVDTSFDRTYVEQWENPTSGLPSVSGLGVDSNGHVTLGGGAVVQPLWQSAVFSVDVNASLVDQSFFIANQAYLVKLITEIHVVACAVASTTAVVKKVISGSTVANGTSLMSSTFALDGTAETLQTATLSTNQSILTLAAGDRLAVDFTGTLTTLSGVCIQVMLQPLGVPTVDVTFAVQSVTQLVDSQFFIANDRYTVLAARCCPATVGSSTPVVQLTKDTSTNAPGAGTDMLANTSNTGFALGTAAATANVPQVASFKTTAGLLELATGDRLSLDFAGTLTAVTGVVVTVSLVPTQAARQEVSYFFPGAATANVAQSFFIADRDYRAVISSGVWAVAAGGTSTANITKDAGTTAAGAGTALLLSAYNLNATAQTVVVDLLAAAPYTTHLRAGDRLSLLFNHAVQSSSGIAITVGLNAI